MKTVFVVFMALAVLIFTGPVLADVSTNVDNSNSNTATSTGGNATQDQNQKQNQDQQQKQTAIGIGGKGGNANATSGNSSADNSLTNTYVSEDKREHITALPGPVGSFVGAPLFPTVDGWKPFLCQPLYRIYTKERLSNTGSSGSFSDRKGGFFHKLFSGEVKKVIHVPFNGNSDNKPVVILNWDSSMIYPSDQLLGEFECEGYYGWPKGAALGRCLAEAKATTNTSRVFAFYRMRRDPKNSGFSIGSGAAGAKLFGSPDDTAVAMSLGGLIGTTEAYVDTAYDWMVLALNDGPTTPPNGVDICSPPPPPKTKVVIVEKKPEPCPPPKVEPPKPVCNPSIYIEKIKEMEEGTLFCDTPSYNNERLRKEYGDAYLDWYFCTGRTNKELLEKAIKQYEIAERDFNNGHESKKDPKTKKHIKTSTLSGAQNVIYKVRYNWALAILELKGKEIAIRHGQEKKLDSIPDKYEELKR
ncbi:MAG: hypothetical protein V1804_03900 [Patescibacteria group bacterium]